eukprot:jgi/Ulvmu1/10502/UM064_0040.1
MRLLPTQPGSCKRLAIGLVGPGMIGKVLMKQIAGQEAYLKDSLGVEVSLVGVTSSRKMLLEPKGLDLDSWQDKFDSTASAADMDAFTDAISQLDSDAVVFDCTASDAPGEFYPKWMDQGVHVITPNKKLHSGPLDKYQAVRDLQTQGKAHYFYETSCGAGLPVLGTLKSLIESGDKVLSIEGILSGTLSYIFNTWRAGEPFSSVVLSAKERGYTEPDPREDLSGMDVARKVTILARECGSKASLEELPVDSLVPETLRDVDTETFLQRLPEYDADMAAQLEEAQAAGNVLRYVGRYDAKADACSINLSTYPGNHPFAALNGSDNIVQIRTHRYNALPLIIRGPGAGAEVTAAGCFADMLQLVRYLGARS